MQPTTLPHCHFVFLEGVIFFWFCTLPKNTPKMHLPKVRSVKEGGGEEREARCSRLHEGRASHDDRRTGDH